MTGFVVVAALALCAGLSFSAAGYDELFLDASGDGDNTTLVTIPPNITCQEGPETGSLPPANETCDCGSRGYFYGNYCDGVDLDAADDINTSKRVMEVRWNANPNFTRAYAFLYRQEGVSETPRVQPLTLEEEPGAPGELGYHYAWLTYLQSGQVRYTVCVLQENAASFIMDAGEEETWGRRINDANRDCVSIETEVSVAREATTAAILIGVAMGVTLIVVFTANLCVNIRSGRAGEHSNRVEHQHILWRDLSTGAGDPNTGPRYIEWDPSMGPWDPSMRLGNTSTGPKYIEWDHSMAPGDPAVGAQYIQMQDGIHYLPQSHAIQK